MSKGCKKKKCPFGHLRWRFLKAKMMMMNWHGGKDDGGKGNKGA
ncbi:MAG: hypothetical protein DFNUSKGM_002593 [Candidatus Fervidibacter sacchari]